jgi:hypothetical protein
LRGKSIPVSNHKKHPGYVCMILVLIISACEQKKVTNVNAGAEAITINSADSLLPYLIEQASPADFIRSKRANADKRLYDTAIFKKINGEIRLPLEDTTRPFVIFSDTLQDTDKEEMRRYEYAGQFENSGFYIVDGHFWEHYESYLVDKKTGEQTPIWNSPLISPNEKFIANLSMMYGMEGVPNGLQIWKINKGNKPHLEKYVEIDEEIWVAEELVWETDNSLLIKAMSVEEFMEQDKNREADKHHYLRIKLK